MLDYYKTTSPRRVQAGGLGALIDLAVEEALSEAGREYATREILEARVAIALHTRSLPRHRKIVEQASADLHRLRTNGTGSHPE